MGNGAGRHIEEIRRLWSHMKAFTKESERALTEWQMVYGTHVFARAKAIPDLAVSRGGTTPRRAKTLDRGLEFLSAGGTALAHLDLGDVEADEEERAGLTDALRVYLALIAQRTLDPEIRAKWFRGPVGGELARIVGPIADDGGKVASSVSMDPQDVALLEALVGGRTDREIAEELGVPEAEVARRLAELSARIGMKSRAEATAFAFREVV